MLTQASWLARFAVTRRKFCVSRPCSSAATTTISPPARTGTFSNGAWPTTGRTYYAFFLLRFSAHIYCIHTHSCYISISTLLSSTRMEDGITCMAFTVSFVPDTGNKYFIAACDEHLRLYDFEDAVVSHSFMLESAYFWAEFLAHFSHPEAPPNL